MSPPPHREKDAKVEGRDPPETAPKETMAPFRRLMGRLLKVKPEEVAERQRLYERSREESLGKTPKKRARKIAVIAATAANTETKPPQNK